MAIEVFNRYEKKYLLDHAVFEPFYYELLEYMDPDDYVKQNSFYPISNIYFDTINDTLIRNSISRPKYKEKLRLRAYGVPPENAKVFLELKKKVYGRVNKRRTKIRINEAHDFVCNGIDPEIKEYMNPQVLSEIKYFLTQYQLQPKVYLAYERKALFSKADRGLRITFDTNIRSRRYDLRLEYGDHGELLLEEGQWLMEIKAERALPVWLTKLLSKYELYPIRFSKYGNEYKKFLKTRNKMWEELQHA